LATLFASDATTIAGVMTEAGDPQARQALFTRWVTGLALPLRQQPEALCLSRWTGPSGTLALLVESPEPLAFSRDVSVTLIEHIKPRWAPIGPPATQAALLDLQFQGTAVNVPLQFAIFRAGDAIVRISQTADGPTLAVYSPPLRTFAIVTPGHLQKIIPEGTVVPPALNALRKFPDGTIALLRSQVLLAAVNPGIPTGPVDKPIALVVFSNGPETAALLLPSSGAGSLAMLGPGTFTLKFAIHRERWRDTSFSNPESQHLGEQALNLNW
jgi:hypothetical protein